jgi:hypothetical protein
MAYSEAFTTVSTKLDELLPSVSTFLREVSELVAHDQVMFELEAEYSVALN